MIQSVNRSILNGNGFIDRSIFENRLNGSGFIDRSIFENRLVDEMVDGVTGLL